VSVSGMVTMGTRKLSANCVISIIISGAFIRNEAMDGQNDDPRAQG